MVFRSFKELAKLVLRYRTYYHDQYQAKNHINPQFPACENNVTVSRNLQNNGKFHRTQQQYWGGGTNQLKLCLTPGCDHLFETEKDLEDHPMYHFGFGTTLADKIYDVRKISPPNTTIGILTYFWTYIRVRGYCFNIYAPARTTLTF